jgi:hypothetical protein
MTIKDKENIMPICFVIMPILDPDDYEKGHFKKVYEDIFKVAINNAGYKPVRADDVLQTNFIHLDILQKLIQSPMAICDLSSRNPNVLFELGLRQAFDMPTVLVQEFGTQKIFDIAPMRITDYKKELSYREVISDQKAIEAVIRATKEATDKGDGINSLINLLSLSNPAILKEVGADNTTQMLQVVMAEINDLRNDFRKNSRRVDEPLEISVKEREISHFEFDSARMEFQELKHLVESKVPEQIVREVADNIQRKLYEIMDISNPVMRSRCKKMLIEIDILLSRYFSTGKK